MGDKVFRSGVITFVGLTVLTLIASKIGRTADYMESLHMSRFRDKSALYYRELKPGEPHSWP